MKREDIRKSFNGLFSMLVLITPTLITPAFLRSLKLDTLFNCGGKALEVLGRFFLKGLA